MSTNNITRRQALLGAGALALVSAPGCGGSRRGAVDEAELPKWAGELQQLFDDSIDPAAVGLSMDGRSSVDNPLLALRVQAAQLVARFKVQTVTRDTVGAKVRFKLGLQVGVPTLLPSDMQEHTVELLIGPLSNAFGILQSLDDQMRGRTFIGFMHKFRGPEGPVLHWHLTADSAEVAAVVTNQTILEEASPQ